jgi:hypothetical protein
MAETEGSLMDESEKPVRVMRVTMASSIFHPYRYELKEGVFWDRVQKKSV